MPTLKEYNFRKQCKFLQLDDDVRLNNNPSPIEKQVITFGNCEYNALHGKGTLQL